MNTKATHIVRFT